MRDAIDHVDFRVLGGRSRGCQTRLTRQSVDQVVVRVDTPSSKTGRAGFRGQTDGWFATREKGVRSMELTGSSSCLLGINRVICQQHRPDVRRSVRVLKHRFAGRKTVCKDFVFVAEFGCLTEVELALGLGFRVDSEAFKGSGKRVFGSGHG